jgi:hypothetical protein
LILLYFLIVAYLRSDLLRKAAFAAAAPIPAAVTIVGDVRFATSPAANTPIALV